jgi:DNA polymerase-3 subunit gamma/tau
LLSVSSDNRAKLGDQAQRWGLQTVLAALQILSEAKGRMFRASYARTIAEMALVRICLLEDLENLDSLIQGLASGTGTATLGPSPAAAKPPAPTPQQSSPAPGAKPPQSTGAEKKSAPAVRSEPVATPPPVAAGSPRVLLSEGCGEELKAQLITVTHDMLKSHIQAVCRIAISGPNSLDFWFPARYDFRKRACERPEVLHRLQSLVQDLTGQKTIVRVKLEEEEPTSGNGAQPAPDRLFDPTELAKKDAFVEKALSLFGGAVVKVEGVTAPPVREE